MNQISIDAEDILCEMYNSLEKQVLDDGKKSIWDFIFNVKNNKRYSVFYASSKKYIPECIVDELIEYDLIQSSLNIDEYMITAKGIVHVEMIQGKDPLSMITESIDDRFFTIEVTKTSDKEKIVLFSLLMLRCFSEKCCVDANKDDYVKDHWMQIFLKAESELYSIGVVTTQPITSTKNDGVEVPMSNIIRHTDTLTKKVRMLYKNSGKHRHYLDLADEDGQLNIEGLNFIVKTIFEDKLKNSDVDHISEICNDSALLDGSYVFDAGVDNYSNIVYDDIIRDSLMQCISDN